MHEVCLGYEPEFCSSGNCAECGRYQEETDDYGWWEALPRECPHDLRVWCDGPSERCETCPIAP